MLIIVLLSIVLQKVSLFALILMIKDINFESNLVFLMNLLILSSKKAELTTDLLYSFIYKTIYRLIGRYVISYIL